MYVKVQVVKNGNQEEVIQEAYDKDDILRFLEDVKVVLGG